MQTQASRSGREDLKHAALAFLAVGIARAGLRTVSLPRLSGLLGIRLGRTRGTPLPGWSWADLPLDLAIPLRSVDAVERWWPSRAPCLVRALAVGWLLNRLSPTLRIGIPRNSQVAWSAHAWLEVGGMTLPEPRHSPVKLDGLRALGRT